MSTNKPLPIIVNRSPEELDDLLKEIKRSGLSEEHQELLTGCVEFASWLPSVLEEKDITIANLRRTLFGDPKQGNKKNKKESDKADEPAATDESSTSKSDADTSDSAVTENDTAEPDTKNSLMPSGGADNESDDESKKTEKGHGRLGHTDYADRVTYGV